MASNPTQVSDVAARFPTALTSDQVRMAQALLDDGWEQILARVPLVEARLDAGTLRQGIVIAVLANAVKSAILNPGGFLEESIDDWTGRRDAATSCGRLLLTDEDLRPLYRSDAQSAAFEIVLGC